MAENKEIRMLAFMPWRELKEPIQLGQWELLPFDCDSSGTPNDKAIKRILDCFRQNKEAPIRGAVLIKKTGRDLFCSLSNDEMSDCFQLGEIVTFAALSMREFFSYKPYSNSSCYKLNIQSFQDDSKGFALTANRRDGSNTNYAPDDFHLVLMPLHVKHDELEFDSALANALIAASKDALWEQLYEGVFSYIRGNTDEEISSLHGDLMFSVGAIQQLLGVLNGDCNETARRFASTLATVLLEEPKPEQSERPLDRFAKVDSMREIWMKDFCTCRGDLTHGRSKPKYPSCWSPHEHLLLASEITPLLVKILLSQHKFYELTDKDLKRIYFFDQRLRIKSLYKVGEELQMPLFGWNESVKKATWQWIPKKEALIPK